MGMIEKVEGEYDELIEKLKVIENDKVKIQVSQWLLYIAGIDDLQLWRK